MQICCDQRSGTGCNTENPDGATHCHRCKRSLKFALHLHDPGVQIHTYQIVRAIGHGGFGAVYEARNDKTPPERVALKENFDVTTISHFRDEFMVLQNLSHQNLPRYYDMFEAEDSAYLVMEYVQGESLEKLIDNCWGNLWEQMVVKFAEQLCDVLSYLHQQKPPIFHRDIKPANILQTPQGQIKLVDFGLLKQGDQTTRNSRRALTAAYAPIEQWSGQNTHTDARSDIYSLGATLYHLLTRQVPPPATERLAVTSDPLVPPLALNPALSPHVAQAVLKAMSVQQEHRFPSTGALKAALVAPASQEPPPPPAYPRFCTVCGNTLGSDEVYCQQCLAPVSNTRRECRRCRHSNIATARFCSKCGTPM
jgi:eukaryotic-like serine/threonine-protein kinase